MAGKLVFSLHQYGLLGVFAVAAYGLGRPLTGWIPGACARSPLLVLPLQMASGMGVWMAVLFVAGVLGYFNAPVVATLILIGCGIGLAAHVRLPPGAGALKTQAASLRRRLPHSGWWVAIAVAVGLPLLLSPLQPPLAWDELMYHLPYARFWAEQGTLAVNEWLRYPLFAYNMELLYGAALLGGSDVLPHLLHALTGALTAVLTFAVAARYMDRRVGLLAVIAVVYATRATWSNAYVDLGLMLFWSAAFAALALRHETGDRRFAYLAAFLAGIAVGIKYQALFYLPVFGVLALAVERRPGVIARSALIFFVFGGYWYLRNLLIGGDPVHPIGAHLFGFWLWNADDLASQYGDLDSVRSRPEWFLFPALGAALFWRGAAVFVRGLMVSAAGAVALWLLLSGHPRYLLPAYPMLALLSAWVLVELWSRSGAAAGVGSALGKIDPRLRSAFAPLLFAAVAVNAVGEVSKVWDRVVPEGPDRGVELARHLAGYDLLRSLGDPPVQTLYQFGFEDEIYYLGRSVRGDWFGPGRYADVLALSHNAPALARHLERLGADGLLLNLAREPFSSQPWDPALPVYFELVGRSGQAALYRLRGAAETAPGGSADQPLNRDAGDGRPLSPTARDLAP